MEIRDCRVKFRTKEGVIAGYRVGGCKKTGCNWRGRGEGVREERSVIYLISSPFLFLIPRSKGGRETRNKHIPLDSKLSCSSRSRRSGHPEKEGERKRERGEKYVHESIPSNLRSQSLFLKYCSRVSRLKSEEDCLLVVGTLFLFVLKKPFVKLPAIMFSSFEGRRNKIFGKNYAKQTTPARPCLHYYVGSRPR